MPRECPFDQNDIFFRKDLHDFKIANFRPASPHSSRHPHAFKYPGGIRRCSDGSGSAFLVRLSVGLVSDSTEIMSFDDTLKTSSLGYTDDIDNISFPEDFFDIHCITQCLVDLKIPEFFALAALRSVPTLSGRGPGFLNL